MPLGKFLSSDKSFSASVVLIGHQQQPADDRQVLQELDPLAAVTHITVEQQLSSSPTRALSLGP